MDQRGDRVQCVKEKVGVDLRLERFQFRLCSQGAQLLLLPFCVSQLTKVAQGHLGSVDDRERDHHARNGHPRYRGYDLEAKEPAADEQSHQRTQDVFEQRKGHLEPQVHPIAG